PSASRRRGPQPGSAKIEGRRSLLSGPAAESLLEPGRHPGLDLGALTPTIRPGKQGLPARVPVHGQPRQGPLERKRPLHTWNTDRQMAARSVPSALRMLCSELELEVPSYFAHSTNRYPRLAITAAEVLPKNLSNVFINKVFPSSKGAIPHVEHLARLPKP